MFRIVLNIPLFEYEYNYACYDFVSLLATFNNSGGFMWLSLVIRSQNPAKTCDTALFPTMLINLISLKLNYSVDLMIST